MGLGQDLLGQRHLVGLVERFADLFALGEAEGVGHAAADEDGVGFLEQGAENADFVAHLGPAQDDKERTLGIGELCAEVAEFFLHEQAGGGFLGEAGTGLGGGVGAVGRAEGVVDVKLGGAEELLGEGGIVLFLLGMEADIFQEEDIARLEGGAELVGFGADAVGRELDRFAQDFGEVGGNRLEGILLLRLALGAAEVAGEDEGGALFQKKLQRGQGFLDAGVVGNLRAFGGGFEGDVEIHPDENLFALGLEILNGQLGHNRINLRCA